MRDSINSLFRVIITAARVIRDAVSNEQAFLSHHFHRFNVLNYRPCVSFEHHCAGWGLSSCLATPKFPENVAIVVFHGRPSPAEAAHGEGSTLCLLHGFMSTGNELQNSRY